MIYTLKILLYVTLQPISVFLHKTSESVYRSMHPFTRPTRIRIIDKRFVKEWLYDIAQGMMNYPVSVRRRADKPSFGIIDVKIMIAIMLVCHQVQVSLDTDKFFFQVQIEKGG